MSFEKGTLFGHALPPNGHSGLFEIDQPIRYQIATKVNYLHRRTDGRHDTRSDGQTSRTTRMGSFLEKEKMLINKTTAIHTIYYDTNKM